MNTSINEIISDHDSTTSSTSKNNNNNRQGTLSSASFNILSTMVGGGCLSLPLAFHQAGNGFFAPVLLICIAFIVEYSIYFLIQASVLSSSTSSTLTLSLNEYSYDENESMIENNNQSTILNHIHQQQQQQRSNEKGTNSYESIACSAFGPKAKYFSMGLVFSICFFTIVGYGVLLRDLLLPLSDTIFPPLTTSLSMDEDNNNDDGRPTLAHNITLLFVIMIVTPLCTLKNLTTLESVGAASMVSIFVVACCISYRSIECNFSSDYDDRRKMPWQDYITYFPTHSDGSNVTTSITNKTTATIMSNNTDTTITAWDNVLNAIPILISVFMCHFNVIPVHNELSNPTSKRVNHLFRTTLWGACLFYLFIGFIGSMYGNCTPNGVVEGNVLLSFDEGDKLLLVGRACLSLTITFAFPILVVPARDTFLRGWNDFIDWRIDQQEQKKKKKMGLMSTNGDSDSGNDDRSEYRLDDNDLSEPLLSNNDSSELIVEEENSDDERNGLFYGDDAFNEKDEEIIGNSIEQDVVEKDERQIANFAEKKEKTKRIVSSIGIFWTGAAIACLVKDIDIIWDFLGGSLSLIMGFTIPSVSFLVLSKVVDQKWFVDDGDDMEWSTSLPTYSVFDQFMAWSLFIGFIPIMFVLTGNAAYNAGI